MEIFHEKRRPRPRHQKEEKSFTIDRREKEEKRMVEARSGSIEKGGDQFTIMKGGDDHLGSVRRGQEREKVRAQKEAGKITSFLKRSTTSTKGGGALSMPSV